MAFKHCNSFLIIISVMMPERFADWVLMLVDYVLPEAIKIRPKEFWADCTPE
jgi:hypothetical protein